MANCLKTRNMIEMIQLKGAKVLRAFKFKFNKFIWLIN